MLMDIRQDLSLSLTEAAWLLGIFNAMGLLAAPLVGSLADWLSHQRAIMLGLGLLFLGSLAGSLAPNGTLLLAARLFEGSGYLVIAVSAPGYLVRVVSPGDMSRAFGLWGAFMPTGGALMMLCSPFIALYLGWRGLWQVNALLLFAYLLFFSRYSVNVATTTRAPFNLSLITGNILLVIKKRVALYFALAFMSYAMMFLSLMGFLPTLYVEEMGISKASASLMGAISLAANIPGNLLGGYLLGRGLSRSRLIAIAISVMALSSFLIFSPAQPTYLRMLFAIIFMGVGGLLPVSCFSGVSHYAPSRELVSTSTGLLVQGTQIGLFIGPPIVAKIVSHYGSWQVVPLIYISFALLGLLAALLIRGVELKES
jgi:MFS family permease